MTDPKKELKPEKKKRKKPMSQTEQVLKTVLEGPTWTLRAPPDVRELLAAVVQKTGVNKLSPLIFDIIRGQLAVQVDKELQAQRERRKHGGQGDEPSNQ